MTRDDFIKRAVREAERKICVPPGWWGTYRDVTNGRTRVRLSGRAWVISCREVFSVPAGEGWHDEAYSKWSVVSRHDSRTFAISKARKL